MSKTKEIKDPAPADCSDQELQAHEAALNAELAVLREQIQVLSTQCLERSKVLEAVSEEQTRRRLASSLQPDWPYLLEETGATNKARYDAANKAVEKLARIDPYTGLRTSGYLPSTSQRGLQVCLIRGLPELTALTVAALHEVLPYLKPIQPEKPHERTEPYKYLSVFESTLSEHGKYWLAVNEELALFELRISRYGRESVVHKAVSLENLLQYVETHHPYESKDE